MSQAQHARFTSTSPAEEDYEWAAAIARSMCAKLPRSFDAEDLEQVARIACFRCAKSYDANRGVYFRRYAHGYVVGAVLMEVRKHWPEPNELSLSGTVRLDDKTLDSLVPGKNGGMRWHKNVTSDRDIPVPANQEEPLDRQMHEAALYRAVAILPTRERAVIAAGSLMQAPMDLVAERLGCSLSLAYVIRQRGIELLRQRMVSA